MKAVVNNPRCRILAFLILLSLTSGVLSAADPYSEAERRITELRGQDGVSVLEIGKSLQQRPIYGVFFAPADAPAAKLGEARRILIMVGQHGNEPTPIRAALSLMAGLAEQTEALPENVREQVVLFFVPVVNPDGYAVRRRCNAAGVDLNRNWRLCDQPETAAISALVKKLRPDVIIDLHEWVKSDTQRPNCIEVAGYGTEPQFKLARVLASIGGQSSPLLSSMAYSRTSNPGLAHRSFADQGICSMLVETDPGRPEAERVQAYAGLVKAVASALASDDAAVVQALAAIRSGQPHGINPMLSSTVNPRKTLNLPDAIPGNAGLCLAAMAGLLAWTFRLNTARRRQPVLELATVGPRTIRTFTVSELIQSDLAPSQKLAIIQRYRLRPTDRAREPIDHL